MTNSRSENTEIIPPSPWVERHCLRIASGGRVLDLACGAGRHARLLSGLGYRVSAIDRDPAAIAQLQSPGIDTRCLDLEGETWPLAGERFAGVVVTNYLWRPRLLDVLTLLAPGGVLIYETFMQGNEAYGKPSRPDFLLASGELRRLAQTVGLRVVDFVEGYVDVPKPAMRQALCAVRD